MRHVAFSLLFLVSSLGCTRPGPRVTVCISNPAAGGAECVNRDGTSNSLPYVETDNYVMFSPDDAEAILNYCKIRGSQKRAAIQYVKGLQH